MTEVPEGFAMKHQIGERRIKQTEDGFWIERWNGEEWVSYAKRYATMSEANEDINLAPANRDWHRLYVRNSLEVIRLLDELQNHPDMMDAEDLGDWVETMSTLMSFRPCTRDDIELEVREEMKQA